MKKKLSLIRVLASAFVGLAMVLTFLGVSSLDLPMVQFLPALLAVHVVSIVAILVVTALVGRIYCSVLCPLGILQDLVWWFAKKMTKRARQMRYTKEHVYIRYSVLLLTILSMAAGGAVVLNLLEPYSLFGRMVAAWLFPLYQLSYNAVAALGNEHGWFFWIPYDVIWRGTVVLWESALSFIIVALLAFRYGRLYCNTICPVGTMLGTVSRFSLYGPQFDTTKCIRCKRCERACRASCIDVSTQRVDASRCVDCFQCMAVCPKDAMVLSRRYGKVLSIPKEPLDEAALMSRRDMLIRSSVALSAAAIAMAKDALPVEAAMDDVTTNGPVMPPGAKTFANFTQRCTACQRCITHCPSGVLQPSVLEYNGAGLWQPRLDFTKGYCAFNCTICSHVCPTGAIQPIALATKKTLQIGKAVYYPVQCLINTEGYACGICARHCPVQAIDMVPDGNGKVLPRIKHSACIGCGSCEYHCPAKTIVVKTMRVQKPLGSGHKQHKKSEAS